MVFVEERAFGYQYLTVGDEIVIEERAWFSIAQIGYNGHFDSVVDGDSLFFEVYDLRPGEREVFGFEFATLFNQAKAQRASDVLGIECAGKEIGANFVFVALFHRDKVYGYRAAIKDRPPFKNFLNGSGKLGRYEHCAGGDAGEFTVRKVVGQA